MEKKTIKDLKRGEYFTSKQHGYLPQEAKDAFENYGIPFSDL